MLYGARKKYLTGELVKAIAERTLLGGLFDSSCVKLADFWERLTAEIICPVHFSRKACDAQTVLYRFGRNFRASSEVSMSDIFCISFIDVQFPVDFASYGITPIFGKYYVRR